MSTLRLTWAKEVGLLLQEFKASVKRQLKVDINVTWDGRSENRVEPQVKLKSRLDHHLPFVTHEKTKKETHLTDSRAIVTQAIREIWDVFKVEHKVLLDYDVWVKERGRAKISSLTNEDYAEYMRLKRKENEKTT